MVLTAIPGLGGSMWYSFRVGKIIFVLGPGLFYILHIIYSLLILIFLSFVNNSVFVSFLVIWLFFILVLWSNIWLYVFFYSALWIRSTWPACKYVQCSDESGFRCSDGYCISVFDWLWLSQWKTLQKENCDSRALLSQLISGQIHSVFKFDFFLQISQRPSSTSNLDWHHQSRKRMATLKIFEYLFQALFDGRFWK